MQYRKSVLDKTFKVQKILLEIYADQFNKPKQDKKKKIASKNKP